jgi:predicted nucleic acid-binding protein
MAAALQARLLRSGHGPTKAQLDMAYALFLRERSMGIYSVSPIDRAVFDAARSLGERFGRELGVRALDVLHVAAAVQYRAVAFGTFDQRQARLAHAVGLKMLK